MVDRVGNNGADLHLLRLLLEHTLLEHLVKLLLLRQDLVLSEQPHKFAFRDFILLLCVQVVAPHMTDQLLVLAQRVTLLADHLE